MLSGLLITLNILVCIALIGVVLLQRSEGGAFGMGGGPTGLITARGAGDLLTRTTWVLFTLFMALSLSLTLLGAHDRGASSLVKGLNGQKLNPMAVAPPSTPAPPLPGAPAQAGGPAAPILGAPLAPPSAPPVVPKAPAVKAATAKSGKAASAKAARENAKRRLRAAGAHRASIKSGISPLLNCRLCAKFAAPSSFGRPYIITNRSRSLAAGGRQRKKFPVSFQGPVKGSAQSCRYGDRSPCGRVRRRRHGARRWNRSPA